MSAPEGKQRRPYFRFIIVMVCLIGVGGVMWIVLVNWFGLIYVAASALFLWLAFHPANGRQWPRQEDAHPPKSDAPNGN